MKTNLKSSTPKNSLCLVCSHALSLRRPILYVAHDNDGVWKFVCRHVGHPINQIKVIPLQQAIQLDASIKEIFDMPPGVGAQRSNPKNKWEPFLLYPDNEEE